MPTGDWLTRTPGCFRAFVKHDKSVKVVTFWGVNDAVSWRAQGRPLLFDGNDQPKPAFDAVIRARHRGAAEFPVADQGCRSSNWCRAVSFF
jgi:hypothetical protein